MKLDFGIAAKPRATFMTIVGIAASIECGFALAQAPDPGAPRRGPPPEALAACQGRAAQDACVFDSPRGKAQGRCLAPEGRPLACVPADAPPPPGMGAAPAK